MLKTGLQSDVNIFNLQHLKVDHFSTDQLDHFSLDNNICFRAAERAGPVDSG